jgi:uncharacterized protein
MPNNNPTGENQHTQNDTRKGRLGGSQGGGAGSGSGQGHGQSGTAGKANPGNFANDRDKAREAGRKGGQHSGGGHHS